MEIFHNDFDSLKRVWNIWICIDSEEYGDSIEKVGIKKGITQKRTVAVERMMKANITK